MSQEFRLENIHESRPDFLEETKQNDLIRRKYKKVYTTLNYINYFLILVSAVTRCILTSTFPSLVAIPIWIASSAIEFKFCVITAGIEKYNSTTKRKKKFRKV